MLGGLGLGVLAVAGCSASSAPSAATTQPVPRRGGLPHDVTAAVELGSAILGAVRVIARVGSTYPALVRRLHPLVTMHEVHVTTLRQAVPGYVDRATTSPAPVTARNQAAALRLVADTERTLHDRLIAAAIAAESGRYARLFGSMSAAISQQLAAMPA
ncbi:MAG: hypothetical protein JWQ32_865 [Marmoricola sp.]|nr:hypothetical protein [Marmoricola sp.]